MTVIVIMVMVVTIQSEHLDSLKILGEAVCECGTERERESENETQRKRGNINPRVAV